jgi:hypothetical protein
MLENNNVVQNGTPIAASRNLSRDEIALLELYQRQDSMSTQLWNHFLLANIAIVGVIVVITSEFAKFDPAIIIAMSIFVLLVWISFTFAGLTAILNAQTILIAIGHQIEGNVGDKTTLFSQSTRSLQSIKVFHTCVDIGIFLLCATLIFVRTNEVMV